MYPDKFHRAVCDYTTAPPCYSCHAGARLLWNTISPNQSFCNPKFRRKLELWILCLCVKASPLRQEMRSPCGCWSTSSAKHLWVGLLVCNQNHLLLSTAPAFHWLVRPPPRHQLLWFDCVPLGGQACDHSWALQHFLAHTWLCGSHQHWRSIFLTR